MSTENKSNIFIRIAEKTPLLNRMVKTRRESKVIIEGDDGGQQDIEQKGYVQAMFGPQLTSEERVALSKKAEPERYEEIAQKKNKEKSREVNRWRGNAVAIAIVAVGFFGICLPVAGALNSALIASKDAVPENRLNNIIFNGGEHGPQNTHGMIDGCNFMDKNMKNTLFDYYLGIKEFTPENSYRRDGLKEFLNDIQSSDSGINAISVFLKEKGVNNLKNGYPQSANICRTKTLPAFEEYLKGKQPNGLEAFKGFLKDFAEYSPEDLKKFDQVVQKINK
jgi:hypothetical protein